MIGPAELAERIEALPEAERQSAMAQLRELIVAKRAALPMDLPDPVNLARAAGFEPDPWQARLLESTSSRILLNCTRQAGKSTMASILAMHTAATVPGSLVLLISPTQRQSSELLKKGRSAFLKAKIPLTTRKSSTHFMELMNGSRLVSLPGKEGNVRGFSGVSLMIIDEAARVPGDLYLAVRPMLAVSDGRLLAMSTPFGARGWWYDEWKSEEQWERFEVPATECPRITEKFLAAERRAMGEWWFAQEYECRFLDAQTQLFKRADVDRAFQNEVEVWDL